MTTGPLKHPSKLCKCAEEAVAAGSACRMLEAPCTPAFTTPQFAWCQPGRFSRTTAALLDYSTACPTGTRWMAEDSVCAVRTQGSGGGGMFGQADDVNPVIMAVYKRNYEALDKLIAEGASTNLPVHPSS